ncbi:hypothetical protein QBE53_01665 [Vallitaleaceae bacterium 9-2]
MFTEKEHNLANEASLTASLLGNGLNALRKADLYNKGLYYQAFFSLSIGIERLLKIIIINKYRANHDEVFPTDINPRVFGHDLIKLCEYIGIKFESNPLHIKMVTFLNDFAKKSRYYNIDSMMNTNVKYDDPLSDWYLLSEDILNSSKKKNIIQNKQEFANIIDSVSLIRFNDLQGNEITNAMGLLDEFESRNIIQSYSVQFMFEIITKLVDEIRILETQKYMMPVLSEFFTLYHKYWKPYEIRKKKDWLRV